MDSTNLKQIFNAVNEYGETSDGMYRLAYTTADNAAHDYMCNLLEKSGYEVHKDLMGNIFASVPGIDPDAKIVATGSHLDTVHCGGKYDGTVGVMAGLYALEQIKERKFGPFFSMMPSLNDLDRLRSLTLTSGWILVTVGVLGGVAWMLMRSHLYEALTGHLGIAIIFWLVVSLMTAASRFRWLDNIVWPPSRRWFPR